ncbi:hypothetical protein Pla52n_68620 [Stieleria varia]|uniref:Uncharacterized protein n=1 Tax=Stieleria varia TaxID=2528005 RepID=A0A5C5ZQ58_9BACT|nr:hypothetical protein Pla52n_68620 [Stieleria varia]
MFNVRLVDSWMPLLLVIVASSSTDTPKNPNAALARGLSKSALRATLISGSVSSMT